jgi:hypothetical protein
MSKDNPNNSIVLPWEKMHGGAPVYLVPSDFTFSAVGPCLNNLARNKMTQVLMISTPMENGKEDFFELA